MGLPLLENEREPVVRNLRSCRTDLPSRKRDEDVAAGGSYTAEVYTKESSFLEGWRETGLLHLKAFDM